MNLLAGAKTQSNPENSVGVLSLAGKVPRVLVTPTDDLGQVLNSVHGITMAGSINFPTGVQVATPQPKAESLRPHTHRRAQSTRASRHNPRGRGRRATPLAR